MDDEEIKIEGLRAALNSVTLRDYFAAAAMQGLIANDDTADMSWAHLATEAYAAADAMIAERSI